MLKLYTQIVMWSILTNGVLNGEVTKLEGMGSFSDDAVTLTFQAVAGGVSGREALSKWGVRFSSINNADPMIRIREVQHPVIPEPFITIPTPVLRNERAVGDSIGVPLIVDLRYPVKRLGLFLANGDLGTLVSISAFDELGNGLGEIIHEGLVGGTSAPVFVGIETESPIGISKVLVDYIDEPNPEELDKLMLDFVARPGFVQYLPQVGDGMLPDGSGKLQTIIVIVNPNPFGVAGKASLFDDNGDAASFMVNGFETEEIAFVLPAFGTVFYRSSGANDPAIAGYAQVVSDGPVDSAAVFRVIAHDGGIIAEAGVGGDSSKLSAVGGVERKMALEFDSGIAVVNTSRDETNKLTLEVLTPEGERANGPVELVLGPGAHIAQFIGELFPELEEAEFTGTLRLRGNSEIAVVILRTYKGIARASLPITSLQ